jgi:succinate dehydrogenase/fumarate reductase flavoprotein subunit
MSDERDWEQEYYERSNDENFERVRAKMRDVVAEECPPEQAHSIAYNHRSFCEAYDRVKKTYFVSGVTENTLRRARSGDMDGAIDLAKEMGLHLLHDKTE